ncbi:MAG: 2-hydroxyacyl-CoA dehydratase family protein [Desulfobacterales bacterium]|nr:2-hydroxyacyl-CoA dehydratase family protein [Desulfobacterales bacterium]
MTEEKKVVIKKLNSAKTIGKFMADYYYGLDHAAKTGEKKVAWCTSVGPAEILRAMDFDVYFPETHSAMIGATRMAADLIPKANAVGYSPDICSYLTADIGGYLEGVSPLAKAFEGIEGPPKPDVLVFNTNQCRDVQDWFSYYGREYNVPVVGVHSYKGVEEVEDAHIQSISEQMKEMIPTLEEVAGKKFDIDRLREVLALSRECSDLWKEVLDTGAAVPSPITFFDGTTLMGPAVVGRGTPETNEVYRILLAELKERVANGEGAVEDERYRIYWDGMPVWGRLSAHAKLFAGLKTNVLASTYCNSWIFSALDPAEPFESMARAYTELFIVRADEPKESYIKNMLDFFKVDGIIYHDAKTCPANTNCRYGMPQRLQEETGIPFLVINGDLNDLRLISDEQTKTNVEAFIEQLAESK